MYNGIRHLENPADKPPGLGAIVDLTRKSGFDMASEPLTGSLLRVLAATKPAGRFLEIGTGTGMGASWLLDGMDAQSTLISVDNDSVHQSIARQVLCDDPRVRFVTGEGGAFIASAQKNSFDLIFADAVPGKYELVDETIALLKIGGIYIVDDMTPQPDWPSDHPPAIAAALDGLVRPRALKYVAMNWATGLMIFAKIA